LVSFLSFDCYAEQQNYCCELRDTTNANRLQPEADNLAKTAFVFGGAKLISIDLSGGPVEKAGAVADYMHERPNRM